VILELWEAVRGCERELRVKARRAGSPRLVRVRIPPGAQRGDRLKVRGLGREGSRGGEPGDLFLEIRVRDHEHFFLEGGELHAHLPITPLEAYAGATVAVPTPLGAVQVRVPPRSQPGMKLRVRGHGVRRGGGPLGDLILHLRVVLPTRDGLAALYRPLDEALGTSVRRGLRFE
jgi:curved DNA-binding protein